MRFVQFLIVLCVLVVCDLPATAQVTFDGCVDVRGIAVASIPNSNINDIAIAAEDRAGRPVIYYNAFVVARVNRQTRLFFYAHECGHHALGHPLRGMVLGQEQEADCWGITTLYRRHLVSDSDVAVIQADVARMGRGDWSHLPGPARAINLVSCLEAAGLLRDSSKRKPPDDDTDADGRKSSRKSNRCAREYQECVDDVQSLDDCMEDRIQSCMRDCLGRFHYPYAACEQRFCNPQMGTNPAWAGRCRQKIRDRKAECMGVQRDCERGDE
jgi:hypothetical protein